MGVLDKFLDIMKLSDEDDFDDDLFDEEEDDFEEERALQKFFDKDALCSLYELFDYSLDMQ